MPLNWLMSIYMYMLGFVFFMMIKIYSMLNNKVKYLNKNFCNTNLIYDNKFIFCVWSYFLF